VPRGRPDFALRFKSCDSGPCAFPVLDRAVCRTYQQSGPESTAKTDSDLPLFFRSFRLLDRTCASQIKYDGELSTLLLFGYFTMRIRRCCDGDACTKSCLGPRIIKHIEDEGYLPTLMSPCIYLAGSPYWMWVSRNFGELVVIDVDAPTYRHIKTKWDVSRISQSEVQL
jgi:hypothetical protein